MKDEILIYIQDYGTPHLECKRDSWDVVAGLGFFAGVQHALHEQYCAVDGGYPGPP